MKSVADEGLVFRPACFKSALEVDHLATVSRSGWSASPHYSAKRLVAGS